MAQSRETITLMLTDIEASTRLFEAFPDVMPQVMRRHVEAIARAVSEAGGTLHEGESEGDSTFSVFDQASAAVVAAVNLQRALDAFTNPATPTRVVLHSGELGPAESAATGSTAARARSLMKLAHGEQIVTTAAVRLLGQDAEGVEFISLGRHRLPDLGSREPLFQVVGPGLRRQFPALPSVDRFPNNLPENMTALLGRQRERESVGELIAHERLVTLIGSAGSGKSRLALQVAADSLRRFQHGAWIVECGALEVGQDVSAEVARVLGLNPSSPPDLSQLVEHLADCEMLLVLDGCEHLAPDLSQWCHRLLSGAARVSVLATSREPLSVQGERLYSVPPLDIGPKEDPKELAQSGAVQLFVARARQHAPDFELTDENTTAVADVCRALDGLPLAIELAAAKIRVMSASDLAGSLSDDPADLDAQEPSHPGSLERAIRWTTDSLSDDELALLLTLSAFVGPFTLDAAASVRARSGIGSLSAIDGLGLLMNRSLVTVHEDAEGARRFSLLSVIRSFAADTARQRGDWNQILEAHGEHYTEQVEAAGEMLRQGDRADIWDSLEAEYANYQAVMNRALSDAIPLSLGLRVARGLWQLWHRRGRGANGLDTLEAMLSRTEGTDVDPRYVAEARSAAGSLSYYMGRYRRAREHYETSLAHWDSVGDQAQRALLLNNLANVSRETGELRRARELYAESLRLKRKFASTRHIGIGARNLGAVAYELGDVKEARECFIESLKMSVEHDDAEGIGYSELYLGCVELDMDRPAPARARLNRAVDRFRELRHQHGLCYALEYLGQAELALDDLDAAAAHLEEALTLTQELNAQVAEATTRLYLGRLASIRGNRSKAVRRFRLAIASLRAAGEIRQLLVAVDHFLPLFVEESPEDVYRLAHAVDSIREATGFNRPLRDRRERQLLEAQLVERLPETARARLRDDSAGMTALQAAETALGLGGEPNEEPVLA